MTTPISPASGAAPLQTPGTPPHHTAFRPGATSTALAITAACLLAASDTAEAVLIFPASHQYLEFYDTGNGTFAPDWTIAYEVVSVLTAALFVFTYVVTCLWLWRVRANAEYLAPDKPHTHRRGWVWGAWVVPIAFLWFPFNVVRDIARATRDTGRETDPRTRPQVDSQANPQTRGPGLAAGLLVPREPVAPGQSAETGRPSSRLLGFWWTAWLVYLVTTQIVSRITPWDGDPGRSVARALVWLDPLNAVACLVALVFWIRVLLGIHHSQEHRQAMVHPPIAFDVPPGVEKARVGALWAVILVPVSFVATFLFLGVAATAGAYEVVKDPGSPLAAGAGSTQGDPGDEDASSGGSGASDLRALEAGDCISTKLTEGPIPDTVNVVDCDTPHAHEVFGAFDLPAGPYPGEKAVTAAVERRCTSLFRDYVGISIRRSELDFMYIYPNDEQGWAIDRNATCLIIGPGTSSSTSYRDSGY